MLSQQELSTLARKATRAARRLAVACDRATYGPITSVPGRREALDALKATRAAMHDAAAQITLLDAACEREEEQPGAGGGEMSVEEAWARLLHAGRTQDRISPELRERIAKVIAPEVVDDEAREGEAR